MKATCYHLRKQDGTKVLGGSFGMAAGDNTDLNQAAEQLTRRMEIAVLPSGRVSFMHAGSPVFVYLSVDPADTEKGKAALRANREARERQAAEEAEKDSLAQEALDQAVEALGRDRAIEILRAARKGSE